MKIKIKTDRVDDNTLRVASTWKEVLWLQCGRTQMFSIAFEVFRDPISSEFLYKWINPFFKEVRKKKEIPECNPELVRVYNSLSEESCRNFLREVRKEIKDSRRESRE